ncbi:MAG: DUF4395 family protein [Eubacteriales bacterium]
MIRMVIVKRQSVTFCKYVIAGLLWLALIITNVIPIYIVCFIMLISALSGVQHAPLVVLYNLTFAKFTAVTDEYINLHSMRFAHIVGCVFCVLSLAAYYLISPVAGLIITAILGLLQTIAAFGYCSAQKLYDCVICNSSCCRFGKKIRSIKKNVR